MRTLKTYKQLFENSNVETLEDELINILLDYSLETDEKKENLKVIIGRKYMYDISHINANQIRLVMSEEDISDLIGTNQDDFINFIYPSEYTYHITNIFDYEYLDTSIIKKINNVFNIEKLENFTELRYFDDKIREKLYSIYHEINNYYEIDYQEQVEKIDKNLIFEFNMDNIFIYPNLLSNYKNMDVFDAIEKQCNNINFEIEPKLTEKDKKTLNKTIDKYLNEILDYCEKHKNDIIEENIKKHKIRDTIDNIMSIGGVFLDKIKSYDYQKKLIFKDIIDKNNFSTHNLFLLNKHKILDSKIEHEVNKSKKSREFNL